MEHKLLPDNGEEVVNNNTWLGFKKAESLPIYLLAPDNSSR